MTDTTKSVSITIPSVFFVAWIVMLVLGALHLDVTEKVPHPGYWLTLLVLWALRLVAALLFGRRA